MSNRRHKAAITQGVAKKFTNAPESYSSDESKITSLNENEVRMDRDRVHIIAVNSIKSNSEYVV